MKTILLILIINLIISSMTTYVSGQQNKEALLTINLSSKVLSNSTITPVIDRKLLSDKMGLSSLMILDVADPQKTWFYNYDDQLYKYVVWFGVKSIRNSTIESIKAGSRNGIILRKEFIEGRPEEYFCPEPAKEICDCEAMTIMNF